MRTLWVKESKLAAHAHGERRGRTGEGGNIKKVGIFERKLIKLLPSTFAQENSEKGRALGERKQSQTTIKSGKC